jgi:hypothetical protein
MSGADRPLTLPSQNHFAGIWANGNDKCPVTLKDLVEVHNLCVKCREGPMPSKGWWLNPDLAPYKSRIQSFMDKALYRLKIVKSAIRIECLDDDADIIPPLFLKRWDKKKAPNAQDDFLREDYVKSFQLAHLRENESFGEFYEAIHKKYPQGKLQLKSNEELQDLCMMCILDYKVLGGCDLRWKETPPDSSSFLRNAEPDADDDTPGPSVGTSPRRSSRRPAAAATAASKQVPVTPAPATPADISRNDGEGASAPVAAAPAAAAAAPRDVQDRAAVDRQLDMDEIVSWGLNDDEFPLNQLDDMKFDSTLALAQQRTYYAAAVLLFYRRRTPQQEKVFRDLSGLWGEARGSHISHAQLCAPPSAGACLYSPDEAAWCADAQKALIAKMDSELRNELEIPETIQERTRNKRNRAPAEALQGQDSLLRSR